MMKQPEKIEPGQVFKDLDIRSKYDEFTVIGRLPGSTPVYWQVQRGPNVTTIREDRLLRGPNSTGSRGYEYVGMKR